MSITITAYRQITAQDVDKARAALRASGISATVRRGQGSTRWTLTVSTREPRAQSELNSVLVPLGLEIKIAANHLTDRFFYQIPDRGTA